MTDVLHHPLAPPARLAMAIAGVRNLLGLGEGCLAVLCKLNEATVREPSDPRIARCDLLRIAQTRGEARP